MIVSDLCTKYRNKLIEVLGKLEAAFVKRKNRNDELGRKVEVCFIPSVAECIHSLKKNEVVSSRFVFKNKKIGEKFIKLFWYDFSKNECSDLIVLLNGFREVEFICDVARGVFVDEKLYDDDYKNIFSCFRELENVFFNAFKDLKMAGEVNLISDLGNEFQIVLSKGKSRFFSRKKCKLFLECYMNIISLFLQNYNVFTRINEEKAYGEGFEACGSNFVE